MVFYGYVNKVLKKSFEACHNKGRSLKNAALIWILSKTGLTPPPPPPHEFLERLVHFIERPIILELTDNLVVS